jgi:hypothetical protein
MSDFRQRSRAGFAHSDGTPDPLVTSSSARTREEGGQMRVDPELGNADNFRSARVALAENNAEVIVARGKSAKGQCTDQLH